MGQQFKSNLDVTGSINMNNGSVQNFTAENMYCETNTYNQTIADTGRYGRLLFRPDLNRLICTTQANNNNYANKVAFLSDIPAGLQSSWVDPNNTVYVAPNFNNTNNRYSNFINAYNAVSSSYNAPNPPTIVVFAGNYDMPSSIGKDMIINAIGKVILNITTSTAIRAMHLYINGDVDINMNAQSLSFVDSNFIADIFQITGGGLLQLGSSNSNIRACNIYTNVNYVYTTEWLMKHTLYCDYFGLPTDTKNISVSGGNTSLSLLRTYIGKHNGTYTRQNAIDDNYGTVSLRTIRLVRTIPTSANDQPASINLTYADLGITNTTNVAGRIRNILVLASINTSTTNFYKWQGAAISSTAINIYSYTGVSIDTIPANSQPITINIYIEIE